MKTRRNIPKHVFYQRRLWIAFATCFAGVLISMASFLVADLDEGIAVIIANAGTVLGFVALAFYLYYWIKRMSVPKEEEWKLDPQPWENSNEP